MEELINSKVLITYLEDEYGKDFDSIKKEVYDSKINVTIDDIYDYLKKKLEKEQPEISKKLKNKEYSALDIKPKKPIIAKSEEELEKALISEICHFEPYSVEYFQKYISILKTKCIQLMYIVEKLATNDISTISSLLEKLDIKLDEEGNISITDVRRLIDPTIYNINSLKEKLSQANNVKNYLSFNLSKEEIYKKGLREDDFYPSTFIQYENVDYDGVDGYIPLSENQKERIRNNMDDIKVSSSVFF